MIVFKYKPRNEQSVTFKTLDDLIEQIRMDVTEEEGWLSEHGKSITIDAVDMTEQEFDSLEEFAGW